MRQYHDTDYLAVSAALHARLARALTQEKVERMLEAATAAEAWKTAVPCGYPELADVTLDAVEGALAEARRALYRELKALAPDKRLVEFFQVKYDYHNAKAALKAAPETAERLVIDCGRSDAAALVRGERSTASPALRRAMAQAKDALAEGGAQEADLLLDRACFEEMAALAKESGSAFLQDYAALQIDAVNLRTLVRRARMGRGEDTAAALLAGGRISAQRLAAARGTALADIYRGSPLEEAAALAPALRAGGSLTEFERRCDDALMDCLRAARRAAFGEQVVVGYLGAKETEFTVLRTIMTGKLAGLDAADIRARLRETYL